jgi:hypothetical protein
MKTWQEVLRQHDPGARRMDADAAARMRDTVVRAVRGAAPPARTWPMRVALAAFACFVLMLSIFGTQRPLEVAPDRALPVAGTERRQIQFATPGGTRIIWEINPNFTLGETLP